MRYLLAGLALGLAVAPLSANNLVTNGDFSDGATGFVTTYSDVISPGTEDQGSYAVLANPAALPGCSGCFPSVGDHTSGTGNMLLVNTANTNSGAFWSQAFVVAANTDYLLSFWATSLGGIGLKPNLMVTVNAQPLLGTGELPYFDPGTPWLNFTQSWNSGSATSVILSFFSVDLGNPYNDFALDDISFASVSAPAAVPEPASWSLMMGGFALLGGALRARRPARAFA